MIKYKVCHMTSVHNRSDGRIFFKMSKALHNAGYNLSVIVADGRGDDDSLGFRIKDVGIENGRINRILKSAKKVYKEALAQNCDIYHFHDPELIPFGLKLKKKGKKVIFDSHEDFPRHVLEKEWIPKIIRKSLSYIADKYINYVVKKFDATITVSPHIVDHLKKYSNHVFTITNYPIIDENQNHFSFNHYIKRSNRLCYSGTIYPNSQQKYILKALENVKDINYTLVGTIDESLFEALSILPAWEKTKFIKRVPKSELLEIYAQVTIGIVVFDYSPNVGYKKGTLGNNKIFEYMLAGLPIICTDFELWKEIIDKYKCGICVNPTNVNEIEDAINYLTNNKEEAYKMGQNGKEAVLKEFNWNTQEKELLKIYKKLL